MRIVRLCVALAAALAIPAGAASAAEGDPPYPRMTRADVEECGGLINVLFQLVEEENIAFSQDVIAAYEPGGETYESSRDKYWYEDAKRGDTAAAREGIRISQDRLATTDRIAWFMTGISRCEDTMCLDAIDATYGAGENFEHVSNFAAGRGYNGDAITEYDGVEWPAVKCVAQVYMDKYRRLHSGDPRGQGAVARPGGGSPGMFGGGLFTGSGTAADPLVLPEPGPPPMKLQVVQNRGTACLSLRIAGVAPFDNKSAPWKATVELKNSCDRAIKYVGEILAPDSSLGPTPGVTIWQGNDVASLPSWPLNWNFPAQQIGFMPMALNGHSSIDSNGVLTADIFFTDKDVSDGGQIRAFVISCEVQTGRGQPLEIFYQTTTTEFSNLACYPIPPQAPQQ